MINARSETAGTKPAFRDALKSRRCLIPADGFYEWARTGKAKQPYCFEVNQGQLFAFAGIWDCWKNGNGESMETCSILTTTPNAVTTAVHDRMPVILEPDSYDLWLDPAMQNVAMPTTFPRSTLLWRGPAAVPAGRCCNIAIALTMSRNSQLVKLPGCKS
jgi:putative SOS response-associated peptidase YedK